MPGLWIVLLLVTCSVAFAAMRFRWRPHLRGWRRAHYVAGVALLCVGAIGFGGSMIAATGGMNWLPPEFELPAGRVSGVIDLRDGTHVVPLEHAGRIQLYDAEWRFKRGWQVDASGGAFALDRLARDNIQVASVRPRRIEPSPPTVASFRPGTSTWRPSTDMAATGIP
jgi:hypothetical protein